MKVLIIVDVQNDFIIGSLGTNEACTVVPNIVDKIKNLDNDSLIILTQDTHNANYLCTNEGKNLPIEHCIENTWGWEFYSRIINAIKNTQVKYVVAPKHTFGSLNVTLLCGTENVTDIEIVGLCTDICVITNVLLVKATCPEKSITVDAKCCAGTSKELHECALSVMRSCQVNVINWEAN